MNIWKKPQEAIFILNEVLEEHPYCEVAWHQLGKIYTQTNRYEEALSAYEFALISDDTFTGAYVEKGKLLEQLGRINEAIENYQIAMQTSDPGGYAYHRIGMCHLQLGNKQLGVNFLKESIHLEPNFEKSWMGLIDFFLKENNNEKALNYCKKGLQANEDSVQLWKKNGEIHYSMKHYSKLTMHTKTRLLWAIMNWSLGYNGSILYSISKNGIKHLKSDFKHENFIQKPLPLLFG